MSRSNGVNRPIHAFDMSFAGAVGKIMISLAPPNPIRIGAGSLYMGPGQIGPSTLAIPNNTGLIGVTVYAQGFVLDSTGTSGIPCGLTDALEMTFR